MPDAELLAEVRHDVFRPVDRARKIPAHLQHVFADGFAEQQRVERDRRLDDCEGHADPFGGLFHRLGRNEAFFFLKAPDDLERRGTGIFVARNYLLGFIRQVDHRSTSPNTGSSEPIQTTMSAMSSPMASFLSTWRL